MANFAVLNSQNLIVNTIVCDSKDLAEQLTNKTCVEYSDSDIVYIAGSWDGQNFLPPAE